jgi:hypothetical protein
MLSLATRIALGMIRITGPALVVLGIGFWTRRWFSLLPLHMMLGMVFTAALLMLAVIAVSTGARRGMGLAASAWAVLVPVFGMLQTRLIPGPLHWTVRVVHLLIGLVAMVLANQLAKAISAHPRIQQPRAMRPQHG